MGTNFEYTIGGQVSQTTGNALNLNGLIIPVQFSPWVKDASGPWLQVPFDEFEFECVALRDPVTRQDFCDTVEFVTTDEGVNIAFGNVVLCPSCSLTGDENGVMFTTRHKGGRELDFRAPVIQSPFLAGSGMSLGDAGTPVDAGAMETEFGNGARGKQCSADSVRVCSGQGNALVPSPTFHGVDLCDSCWLVGGANGVFFSVQHTQGFELTGPVEALPPSCLSVPPTSTRR